MNIRFVYFLALTLCLFISGCGAENVKEVASISSHSENFLPVEARWGFVEKSGKFVIPPKFIRVKNFSEGVAAVQVDNIWGKWGYIDKSGNWVIEPKFDKAHSFCEGRALVEYGGGKITRSVVPAGHLKFINKKGDIVVENPGSANCAPHRYSRLFRYSNGLSLFCNDLRQFGYIDKNGSVVIKPRFSDAKPFKENLAAVNLQIKGKYGFIDTKGDIVIKPQFTNVRSFSGGLAAVVKDGKWGYIDRSGGFIIQPKFDIAESFNSGLAVAGYVDASKADEESRQRLGYITKDGGFQIKPRFEFAEPFSDGWALVGNNKKPFYIDVNGTEMKKNLATSLIPVISKFHEGRALIKKGIFSYEYIDTIGKTVFTCPKTEWKDPTFGFDKLLSNAGSYRPQIMYFSEGLCPTIKVYKDGPKFRKGSNAIIEISAKNYFIQSNQLNELTIKSDTSTKRIGPTSQKTGVPTFIDLGNGEVYRSRALQSRNPITGNIEWTDSRSNKVIDGVSFDGFADGYITKWNGKAKKLTVYCPDGKEILRDLPIY